MSILGVPPGVRGAGHADASVVMVKTICDAPEMHGQSLVIDVAHVRDRLSEIVKDEDLSRYIL